MPWTDKIAIQQFIKLRDKFGIRCLIETGTAEGNSIRLCALYFQEVHSCEIDEGLLERARQRTIKLKNVFLYHNSSPDFIRDYRARYERLGRNDTLLFFLDAHKPDNWPVLDELRALRGFRNCCITIHDFKVGGLGHICYGGQDLDFDYVKDELLRVNDSFHFYHNDRSTCQIWTVDEVAQGEIPGLLFDEELKQWLEYTWSTEQRTYRGILYCVPEALDETFQLKGGYS